jgi:hypothetical protein
MRGWAWAGGLLSTIFMMGSRRGPVSVCDFKQGATSIFAQTSTLNPYTFESPYDMTMNATGFIFVINWASIPNVGSIMQITPDGKVTAYPSWDNGIFLQSHPRGICVSNRTDITELVVASTVDVNQINPDGTVILLIDGLTISGGTLLLS